MENLHIDYNALYSKAKNMLMFSSLEERTNIEYLISLFIRRETEQENGFLCPLFLYDKKEEKYYPVLFYKVRNHRIVSSKPIFSSWFLDYFSSLGADASYFEQENGIRGIHDAILDEIDVHKIYDKAELICSVSFVGEDLIGYSYVYPLCKEKIFAKNTDTIDYQVSVSYSDEEEYSFFKKEHSLLNHLETEKKEVIIYDDENIINGFMIKAIRSFLQKNQNVLIVVSDDVRKEIHETLEKGRTGEYIQRILNTRGPSETDDSLMDEFQMKEERYFSFEDKKKSIFSSEKINECSSYKKVHQQIDLDIDGYDEDDRKADEDLLSFMEKSRFLSDGSYLAFEGIQVSPTEENYEEMHNLITEIVSDLEGMKKTFASYPFFETYDLGINSFSDMSRVGANAYLLREYNGFPKKYFSLDNTTEENLPLSYLKTLFQSVSSSKLVIRNLCVPEIFDIDILSLVNEYKKAGFFGKMKAEKKITGYLKSKKRKDVSTIARVLDSYISSMQKIGEILPDYIESYGESVSNMNGVVEIESNVDYINRFRQRNQEDESFSLENPYIKRCIKDKEFRLMSVDVLIELSAKSEEILGKISKLHPYFRFNDKEILFSDIDSIMESLNSMKEISFEVFEESSVFEDKSRVASLPLQLALRQYRNEKKNLSSFPNDFRSSYLYLIHQKKEEEFSAYEEGYDLAYDEYYDTYSSLPEKMFTDTVSLMNRYYELLNTDEDKRNQYHHLQERREKECMEQGDEIRLAFYENPIQLCTKEELIGIQGKITDNLLILKSSDLEDEEIVCLNELSDKTMFINFSSNKDQRINGFREEHLSKESMFSNVFDFSLLNKEYMKNLSASLLSHQLFLTEDDPVFPLVIIDMNSKKKTAILPDAVIASDYDSYSMAELRNFLYLYHDVFLVEFSATRQLFREEELMKKIK